MTDEERENNMIHIIMPKYALETVLKKFREQGKASVTKELTQLHVLETFAPVGAIKLNMKLRLEAVASLMSLKENQNGDIKGRTYAYGIK